MQETETQVCIMVQWTRWHEITCREGCRALGQHHVMKLCRSRCGCTGWLQFQHLGCGGWEGGLHTLQNVSRCFLLNLPRQQSKHRQTGCAVQAACQMCLCWRQQHASHTAALEAQVSRCCTACR